MDERKEILWCPKCDEEPQEIVELYDNVEEKRTLNGGIYELTDSSLDVADKTVCAKCRTEVVTKEAAYAKAN